MKRNDTMRGWALAVASAAGLLVADIALANDDFFGDITTSNQQQSHDSWLSKKFFVQQKLKYGLQTPDTQFAFERDKPGLSQVQTDLFGELEGDINSTASFQFSAKIEFDALRWENGEQVWEIHRQKFLLKDALVDLSFDNGHWLRLGHQLFAWGESETLAITDVLAPTDQREFGQAELQDIREHIPAAMYSFPTLNGKLAFVATYQAGHNRYAEVDEAFYPYIALKDTGINLQNSDPEQQWEAAIRYERQFNGGDISIVAAETNTNDFYAEELLSAQTPPTVNLVQKRVSTLAMAANKVWDSWLFKAELGLNWDQPVNLANSYILEDQARLMLGVEYAEIDDWMFRYELTGIVSLSSTGTEPSPHSEGFSSAGHTVHIQQKALNEKFTQDLWFFDLLDNNGKVFRWHVNYNYTDSWGFAGAIVLYGSNKRHAQLYPYRKNDTLNFSVKYSF